jgi:hypothetical protein
MTRITSLGMKRTYKDAQFNILFESREQGAIAGMGGNTNENEEGPVKKKRKRSKNDTDDVQTSVHREIGLGKSQELGKKRFAAEFSRAKTNGTPRCSYV